MENREILAYSQLIKNGFDSYGHAPAYDGEGVEEVIFSFSAYHSYYVVEHGATKNDFKSYCSKLIKCGFWLYFSNESNGNSFATYTDGDNIVNVSHISYKNVDDYVTDEVSYVLISVDSTKNSMLPCKCAAYEKITKVQVSMVNIILSLIIRLEDGRFIVIDGGLRSATKLIYSELCKQNVLGDKPIVAAWAFSHPHCDHVGGFLGILDKYSDKIEIQSIIHNFAGESVYMNKNYMEGGYAKCNDVGNSMNAYCNKIHDIISEKMPNCKFAIAHTGQVFEYPGVKLEVMMTAENIYKKQMLDTNMSSAVYRVHMPGGSMLALGDAVDAASKMLRRIHAKNLKSDAVVIAHHAVNGGDEEMYQNVGAKAAIWSNTLETIEKRELIGHFTNHFDVNSVEYNLIVSEKDSVMTLYYGMSEEELSRFARRFDVPKRPSVDYEKRKYPKIFFDESYLDRGFGNAPRYYGAGEDDAVLEVNENDKTWKITIPGTTAYNFEYYCNTLKRDGYWPVEKISDDNDYRATYADPIHAVYVNFDNGVLTIIVGKAGENAFLP